MTNKKKSLKLPIFLIIGPTLGLITAVFLYAVLTFVFSGYAADDTSMGGIEAGASYAQGGTDSTTIFRTVSNIFLFVLGSVSVLSFLPSLIFGLYLLNKRRKPSGNDQEISTPHSRNWGDVQ